MLLQNGSLQLIQLLSKLDYSSISFVIALKGNGTIKSENTAQFLTLLELNNSSAVFVSGTNMQIYVGHPLHSANSSAVFASPWTRQHRYFAISFPENVPSGYVVYSLPAFEPSTQLILNDVSLSGLYADHFNLDTKTGVITLIEPLNFDQLEYPRFQLKLEISGEGSNGTWAVLNITLIDVDDNPPSFINKVGPSKISSQFVLLRFLFFVVL